MELQAIYLRLRREDIVKLKHSANVAQRLENKFGQLFEQAMDRILREAITDLMEDGRINSSNYDLEDLFMRHWFESQRVGFEVAESDKEFKSRPAQRLTTQTPRSLKGLMELYDQYKKKRYVNKRKRAQAEQIKKEYLNRIQDAWRKSAEEFLKGEEFNQEQAYRAIKEQTKAPRARVQTIVNTETTNYYNSARKAYYDASSDVDGYIFMAVRDAATTKWCSPKTTNGKRGRHGLVYFKGDKLTSDEEPACHWNCRSEMLPLTRHSPVHNKLLADRSIWRRNVTCHPLPPGWR